MKLHEIRWFNTGETLPKWRLWVAGWFRLIEAVFCIFSFGWVSPDFTLWWLSRSLDKESDDGTNS